MKDPCGDAWDRARQDGGLTVSELWLRYFALGGTASALSLDAWCHGALPATGDDHHLVVQALNERFMELGDPTSLPYPDDPP